VSQEAKAMARTIILLEMLQAENDIQAIKNDIWASNNIPSEDIKQLKKFRNHG
jgi:hypothetical protein